MPKVGCHCPTCDDALKSGFERKRFGLVVETESGTRVLVDASPDLRRAFLQLGFSSRDFDALLLTHEHYDHTGGLGDFFYEGTKVGLCGLPECLKSVLAKEAFGYLLEFDLFDVRETEYFAPFFIGDLQVTPLPVEHSVQTQGFLFQADGKRVAVLSDCRHFVQEKTSEAVRGVDLLFTDGWLENREQFVQTYRLFLKNISEEEFRAILAKKKLNHFLIPDAIAFGEKVGAKKTVLLHVAHGASTHKELVQKYGSGQLQIGYDGLVCVV